MIKIRINNIERELKLNESFESWINHEIRAREDDGQPVTVQLLIKIDCVDITLSTPQPGGGNGRAREFTSKESAIIALWVERHLNQQKWEVGNLIAFLKQLRKLI